MANSDTTPLDSQAQGAYDVTVFEEESLSSRFVGLFTRNKLLFGGLILILSVVLFAVVGSLTIDPERGEVGFAKAEKQVADGSYKMRDAPRLRPSFEFWLGTDQFARDVFAYVAFGTLGTLWMGLIAGIIGIGIGTLLGFVGGYFGGWLDAIVVVLSDALITIPGLMLLITISAYLDQLTVEQLGILIGVISWMGTTRVVRAQVLTLKNRAYVEVSKFNGQGDMEIVLTELIPNLAPFIAAAFVGAVAGAILLSIGLSALGLGPQNEPSLGLMAFWFIRYGAVPQGMWWWFGPPIVVIAIFVVGLFMVTAGLDQIANPRLRTSV